MASFHPQSKSYVLFSFLLVLEIRVSAHNKKMDKLKVGIEWLEAGATWYGSPTGFGSDGGACGYGNAVSQHPFSSMITAIGPSKFNSGKGCGACYHVKCTSHPSCSGKPIRVVVTDLCPGGPCVAESTHFDLSGTAFGALAKPGHQDQLRNAGVLKVQWSRVKCDYGSKKVHFEVDKGANPYYLSVIIKFTEGDGDVSRVFVKEGSSGWKPMQQLWGAVWKINSGTELKPPFSFMLKSRYSGDILIADNVIPHGWYPGTTYASKVNFNKT